MISFIIPVYNKGSILFKTLQSLIGNLTSQQITNYEIIVVNDGSTDNSLEETIRFKKFNGSTNKIKIYYYSQNIGKGFALRFGFSKSEGDPIVFLDGDMDIDTKQVTEALRVFNSKHPDMVIGSKYASQSRTFYPTNRYLYSFILKVVISILFHLRVSDTQVGLKVFRRDLLTQVFPQLIVKRFAVDLELLMVAYMQGFTHIEEIPVIIRHSSASQSSIDIRAVKNFCIDIVALFYRKNILNFYKEPKTENFLPSMAIGNA